MAMMEMYVMGEDFDHITCAPFSKDATNIGYASYSANKKRKILDYRFSIRSIGKEHAYLRTC